MKHAVVNRHSLLTSSGFTYEAAQILVAYYRLALNQCWLRETGASEVGGSHSREDATLSFSFWIRDTQLK